MREIKDTIRAEVRIGYDGRVHKRYKRPLSFERFKNEVWVLKYLDKMGCTFVPKLLQEKPEELYIITTNCGHIAPKVSEEKVNQMFQSLEQYGVKHGDAFARNITYDNKQGCFCVIDFEFATILETGEGLTIEEAEAEMKKDKYNL